MRDTTTATDDGGCAPVSEDAESAAGLRGLWRKAAKGVSLVSLTNVLQRGLGFFLLPLYTRYLSPADYGQVEILMVSVSFANVLLAQGLPSSLMRQLSYVHGEDDRRRAASVASVVGYVLLSGAVFIAVVTAVAGALSDSLLGSPEYRSLVLIGAGLAVLASLRASLNAVLLTQDRVSSLVSAGLFHTGVKLVLNVWFVVGLEWGFPGIIWSHLLGDLGVAVTLLWLTRRQLSFRIDGAELRSMLAYGLPLVLSVLSLQVLRLSDRYFLRLLAPADDLGLYAVSNKFSSGFYVAAISPFVTIWWNSGLQFARRPGGREEIARCASLFLVLGTGVCLAAMYALEPVVGLMVAEPFLPAYGAIGILMAGMLFLGLAEIFKVGLKAEGASGFIAGVDAAAAVANVILNLLLIPIWGFIGAAVATATSYALLAVTNAVGAQRRFPVPYAWRRLVGAGALLLAAVLAQPVVVELGPWQRLGWALAVLAAYGSVAWLWVGDEVARLLRFGVDRLRGDALVGETVG